ncbi:hypothetical protein Scep_002758 [Stephania cephalantha]|uniref:Uncharacterized protein n=1 Tax=Stephania cephalantha TaxID=152367 RepID=A0AAP0LC62_9MAGN
MATEAGMGSWYFLAKHKDIAVEKWIYRHLNITEHTRNECFKLELEESFIPWCVDMVEWFIQNPDKEEHRLRREQSTTMMIQIIRNIKDEQVKIHKLHTWCGWRDGPYLREERKEKDGNDRVKPSQPLYKRGHHKNDGG